MGQPQTSPFAAGAEIMGRLSDIAMNSKRSRSVFWRKLFLFMVCATSTHAAIFEVAQRHPQASDSGDGSPARPWKTMSMAIEKVGPGDKVIIREGIYREAVVLKTSGTEQAPILFEAAPG